MVHHLGYRSAARLDYIESLLNSTGLTLSAATRDALGRSVSMDGLSIGEASDLIDYLKELPGGRQGDASRRRAANRGGKVGVVELRPLLNRPDVLVVDVETTGLGDRAEVLAIAVIDTSGRVLLDTVSMPQGRIPTEASDVHGLTRPRLRSMGARPWPEVHGELVELLRGAKIVIAWNVEYDSRLLHQTAKRHGLTLPSVTWRCAMEAETTTRGPDAPYAKLTEVARCFGVSASGAHNALSDVRITLAVVRALVGGTPRVTELHAEIARLRGDLDFERDVADKPRAFGPPPGGRFPAASRRYMSTTCWRPASSARPPIRTALGIGPDAGDE